MIEDTRSINRVAFIVLALGLAFILLPLVFVVVTATQSYGDFLRNDFSLVPGTSFFDNLTEVWERTDLPRQTLNSIIVSAIASSGRILLAFTTAFAVVFFHARYRPIIYAAVLASIMLPIELMVITAYQVAANVALPLNAVANVADLWASLFGQPLNLQANMLDTYAGIAVPLMAQGSATLILVQYFRTISPDLAKAATIDGAGPLRFMWDMLLPLSKGPLLALGIYMFIGGWTQYMWPLIAASSPDRMVAVVGLTRLSQGNEDAIANFPVEMTGAILVTLPPLILIALFQRQIVRNLTISEK